MSRCGGLRNGYIRVRDTTRSPRFVRLRGEGGQRGGFKRDRYRCERKVHPPSRTTILSALAIVERRWATKRHVVWRERRILSMASFTCQRSARPALTVTNNMYPRGVLLMRPRSLSPRQAPRLRVSSGGPGRWRGAGVGRHLNSVFRLRCVNTRKKLPNTMCPHSACRNRPVIPKQIRSLPHGQQLQSAPL